jgi:hypothetical protein
MRTAMKLLPLQQMLHSHSSAESRYIDFSRIGAISSKKVMISLYTKSLTSRYPGW